MVAAARAPWPGGLDSPIVAALRGAANNNPAAWADARGRAAGMFAGHERGQALADDAPAIGAFKPSPAMIPWMVEGGRRILVRAGNRVGKSRHAAARLVAAALTHPGGLYRAVGVTFKQAARVVGKLLHEFIPPRAIRRGSHYDSDAGGWTMKTAKGIVDSAGDVYPLDNDAQTVADIITNEAGATVTAQDVRALWAILAMVG